MCFDLLPDSSSLPQMTTNYCSLGCYETDTGGDTTTEDDTRTEDTEGNTDVL